MRFFTRFLSALSFSFIMITYLYSAVGDWQAAGSLINVKKIFNSDQNVIGATEGGLLIVDVERFTATTITNTDFLDHINISSVFGDEHGHLWIGYDHSPSKITCKMKNGTVRSFDFGFDKILTISGRGDDVIVSYKKGLSYGLAHFITNDDYIAFKDTYENFPLAVDNIVTVSVTDSLILFSSSSVLFAGRLQSSNLKPASQWNVFLEQPVRAIGYYDNDIYVAYTRKSQKWDGKEWTDVPAYSGYTPHRFFTVKDSLFLVDRWGIFKFSNDRWVNRYSSPYPMNDAIAAGDTLILAEEKKGLRFVNLSSGLNRVIRPNSPFATFFNAVDVDDRGLVYFANRDGIAIYNPDNRHWHNLIRADTLLRIHPEQSLDSFSADTLAYSVIASSSTKIFDFMVGTNGKLYSSFEGFYIDYPRLNYDPVVKPGPLLVIDRDDYSNYTMIDTTRDVFHGSEASVGGENRYLVLRGMAETRDGSIWVVNAHAANNEPLVRFKPDGEIQKFSLTDSENALELLPTEMTTDAYDRLWIGLQSHPQNDPITYGGIAVYDYRRDLWYRITSTHGLTNNNVLSIDKAQDGTIWIVTSGGVQSITPPVSITRFLEDILSNISAPIPAVSDANIIKVRVDGRNNKWLLTSDGGVRIYLNNSTYFNSGYGYTGENSPLLDPFVSDVAFDFKTGKAYLATAGGINILETPWSAEIKGTDNIKIYPQPYSRDIDDRLIIDGLPDQSTAKIVTLGGRMIHTINTASPHHFGNQIIWNGILDDGSKIDRGVYYLFVYNVNGENKTLRFAVK
jgi:hypothetical protein